MFREVQVDLKRHMFSGCGVCDCDRDNDAALVFSVPTINIKKYNVGHGHRILRNCVHSRDLRRADKRKVFLVA